MCGLVAHKVPTVTKLSLLQYHVIRDKILDLINEVFLAMWIKGGRVVEV